MKRFALITKQDEKSNKIKAYMIEKLKEDFIYDNENPDLVIFIGGDGTMLDACKKYLNQLEKCVFVGLHTGTLGFYTDYLDTEVDQLIEDIQRNEYTLDYRDLLEISDGMHTYYALNEVRLEENQRTMVCDIWINHEFLETFRGNGLCVSTPSGSTAYNRSLGGSVVCPTISCMQLSEIAGIHHNAYRSLGSSFVVDDRTVITLEPQVEGCVLGIDREAIHLEGQTLEIKLSDKRACFIHYNQKSMVARLRKAFISG